jgi:hypothetical protein
MKRCNFSSGREFEAPTELTPLNDFIIFRMIHQIWARFNHCEQDIPTRRWWVTELLNSQRQKEVSPFKNGAFVAL